MIRPLAVFLPMAGVAQRIAGVMTPAGLGGSDRGQSAANTNVARIPSFRR